MDQDCDSAAAGVTVRSCCRRPGRVGVTCWTWLSAKSEVCLTDKEMLSWWPSGYRTVAQTARDDSRGILGRTKRLGCGRVLRWRSTALPCWLLEHPASGHQQSILPRIEGSVEGQRDQLSYMSSRTTDHLSSSPFVAALSDMPFAHQHTNWTFDCIFHVFRTTRRRHIRILSSIFRLLSMCYL